MATTPIDPKLVLLSIINQLDGGAISTADVDFDLPQRATGPTPLRNTKVRLFPKMTSEYFGSRLFWYNRIHVSEISPIAVNKGTANSYWDLIDEINETYGLFLSTDDIVDTPIPPEQTGLIYLTLDINPNSLMFYGGPLIITPDYTADGPSGPPVAGTLLSQACSGLDLMGTFADGSGGSYVGLLEANSLSCGYIPPTTTPPPTVNNTITTITSTPEGLFPLEGEVATVTYNLSNPIITSFNAHVTIVDEDTDMTDYADLQYSFNESGTWFTVPIDGIFNVPPGVTHFKVRVEILEDLVEEIMEYFSIVLNIDPATSNVTNAGIDLITYAQIFVPTTPPIISPAGMDLFRAATGVDRSTSQSNSINFTSTEPTGIFGKYEIPGRQYFEVSITGALSPTSKVLVGVATVVARVDADYTQEDTQQLASALDIRTGIMYLNNTNIQTSLTGFTSSSILGVAVDPTYDLAYQKTITYYLDGVLIDKFSIIDPDYRIIFAFISCNDPAIIVNINSGETPFTQTVPEYYPMGHGNVPLFLDDYENNNKGFTNASLLSETITVSAYVDPLGTDNQELMSAYDEVGGYFELSYLLPDKPVLLIPPSLTTSYRLTIDFEYSDGADLGGGNYTPSFFRLVTDDTYTTIYNRDTDGSQKMVSGTGDFITGSDFVTVDSSKGLGAGIISIPFSGRHKIVYEVKDQREIVASDPTVNKVFSLWIDDVLIAQTTDSPYIPANSLMTTGFYLGNCGSSNRLYSIRVDELARSNSFYPSYFIAYDGTYDPIVLSTTHTVNDFTLEPDNLTFNIAGPGLTVPDTRKLYYYSYYWEYHVLSGAPSGTISVGVASTNILDSVDPFNDTDSLILTRNDLPPLNVGDVIQVKFDPNFNGLEILVNEISLGNITVDATNAVFVTSWVPVFIQETATTPYTVKAIFEESELTYVAPFGWLPGIKTK